MADACSNFNGEDSNKHQLRFWQGELHALGRQYSLSASLMRLVSHNELRAHCVSLARAPPVDREEDMLSALGYIIFTRHVDTFIGIGLYYITHTHVGYITLRTHMWTCACTYEGSLAQPFW